MSKKELISIGDCTIDAFIKLHDASVHCNVRNECELCMSFADKIPYEWTKIVPAVGNAANVAVGATRLGHQVKYFGAVGKDEHGDSILRTLRKEQVNISLLRQNPGIQTNYHYVLTFQGDRTILVKHHAFKYFPISKIGNPEWIFFTSMGENSLPLHHDLVKFLQRHKKTKMGFNPGTFQMKMGRKKLAGIYEHTYVLFVNREEAQRILGVRNPEIKYLMKRLHGMGPKIVCITDGPDGAYASDGEAIYYMRIYPDPKAPFERTGAGDSFSTGFMSALMYGLPIHEALRWAPINSMSVVQYVGAREGLLTKSKLLSLLKKAPKNYVPKRIN